MNLTRRLRLGLGALAFCTMGATLLVDDPASAAPAKPDTPTAPLHGDACTAAPDSGPFFDFHQACHQHDDCYSRAPYGRHEVGRARCDGNFLADMYGSCSNRYPNWYQAAQRAVCMRIANEYYAWVRAFGAAFFY